MTGVGGRGVDLGRDDRDARVERREVLADALDGASSVSMRACNWANAPALVGLSGSSTASASARERLPTLVADAVSRSMRCDRRSTWILSASSSLLAAGAGGGAPTVDDAADEYEPDVGRESLNWRTAVSRLRRLDLTSPSSARVDDAARSCCCCHASISA